MLLFHGFPSVSHMFRDLMPMLEDRFHCIAPDYPGFGNTDSSSREEFAYTFDHLAEVMDGFIEALHIDNFYVNIKACVFLERKHMSFHFPGIFSAFL